LILLNYKYIVINWSWRICKDWESSHSFEAKQWWRCGM